MVRGFKVLGEVDLPIVLENRKVIIRGVTTENVTELLLEIDWL